MKRFRYLAIITAIILLSFCARNEKEFDANGHFETTEYLVSGENPGRLVFFSVEPGMNLKKEQIVGVVDTMALTLRKEQVVAQINAALAKIPGIKSQKSVVEKEVESIEFELDRVNKLVNNNAVPRKQFDDLIHKIGIAKARLKTFDAQIQSVMAETEVMKAQLNLYNDQISRSAIKAPVDGLVLERYARESEMVSAGKILFSMAATKTMELKAYISGAQLSQIEIGQDVKIRIDWGEEEYREYPGKISWVSDEAEFTPKIIQTHDERVNLVYAIKILVENDGKIKIGMPGEVIF